MQLTDAIVRSTALFSFLSLASDKQALKVSQKTLEALKKSSDERYQSDFVRATFSCWKRYFRKKNEIKLNHKMWRPPQGFNLSIWTEFRQKSDEEEFLSVLLAKVIVIV